MKRGAAETEGTRLLNAPVLFLLAVLGLAGYGFTLGDFFLADDFLVLLAALDVSDHGGPWVWALDSNQWLRPITYLLFWANAFVGGTEPFGYHFLALLFHVVNAWLLVRLCFRLFGHARAAVAVGAIFVVFPLHPEAVTWISGRVDVICATRLLASLLAWTRFLDTERPLDLAGACAGMTWALLSKEMAITLPALALILGLRPHRVRWPRVALGLVLLSFIGCVYFLARESVIGGAGGYPVHRVDGLHASYSPSKAVAFTRRAVELMAVPGWPRTPPNAVRILHYLPLFALALGIVLGIRSGRLRIMLSIAVSSALLFLFSMAPVAGWFGVGQDYEGTRYLYLPSAFACLGMGCAFVFARRGHGTPARLAVGLLVAPIVVSHLTGLVLLNQDWHTAARTLERMVRTLPEPESGSHELVLFGIPRRLGGAFVSTGFAQSIQLFTDWSRAWNMPTLDGWEKARQYAALNERSGVLFLQWDSDAQVWQTPSHPDSTGAR